MSDFEEVKAEVLLESKGGCRAKAGDPDGFGGYYSMDEVVVTRSWNDSCPVCSEFNTPRSSWITGRWFIDYFMHSSGCPEGP